MATTTYMKTNIWAYLSRVKLTGVVALVIVALFAGQGISYIGIKYFGLSAATYTFKAGWGLQYVFYFLGFILATYAVGWFDPSLEYKDGGSPWNRLIFGLIGGGILIAIGFYVLPMIPGLMSVFPMQSGVNLPPFSVVPV